MRLHERGNRYESGRTRRLLKATIVVFLTTFCCATTLAGNDADAHRGKVIIIRGAFTVFSLGMNDLGEKLREYGFDVDVVADISAGHATSKIISEYQQNDNFGPIVFIGHSRGAELGPKQSRKLLQHRIPVKLVVMVDGTHKTTIPGNVERCVNFFQHNTFSLPHGLPTKADSRQTQLFNVDIDQLPSRDRGGSINHFNIDSSPWIHELVILEVLKACPARGPEAKNNPALRAITRQSAKQPVWTRFSD